MAIVKTLTTLLRMNADDFKKSVDKAKSDYTKFSKNIKKENSLINKNLGSLKTALAAVGVGVGLSKVTSELSDMEKKVSALSGAVGGDLLQARVMFDDLNELSRQLPQSFDDITKSALNLSKVGLTADEDTLKAISQIAVGTGKDMSSVSDTFSKAVLGQTKSLKELGIVAVDNGNTISATFKGQTVEVGKTTQEMSAYLQTFAKENYGATLDYQMQGITGTLKNVGDAWGDLFRQVGESGLGEVIKTSLDILYQSVDKLTSFIANNTAFNEFFDGLNRFIVEAVEGISSFTDFVSESFNEMKTGFSGNTSSMSDDISFFFGNFFDLLKIGLMKVTNFADGMSSLFVASAKVLWNEFQNAISTVWGGFKALFEGLKTGWKEALSLNFNYSDMFSKIGKSMTDAFAQATKNNNERLNENINIIDEYERRNKEADTAIAMYQEDLAKASVEREKKREEEKITREEAKQKLLQKKLNAMNNPISFETGEKASSKTATKEDTHQFDELNKLKEELAQIQYERLSDVEKEKIVYSDRIMLIDQYYANRLISLQEYNDLEKQITGLHDEEMTTMITDHYAKLGEETAKRREKEIQAQSQYTEDMKDAMSGFGDAFGSIANSFEESSTAYKAFFAVQKGFTVASATLSMYSSLADAMNTAKYPFPSNLALYASALSSFGTILSTLKSVSYSGAYDVGGTIPSGSVGLVGEIGPELVSGPMKITGRKKTEDLLSSNGNSDPQNVIVNVNEDSQKAGQVNTYQQDEQTIIDVFVNNIRKGGQVAKAVQSTYNLKRLGV